jgi:hypothetical protein
MYDWSLETNELKALDSPGHDLKAVLGLPKVLVLAQLDRTELDGVMSFIC